MPHYRPHRDPRSSHQQIARIVRARAGAGPVLDVGCAQGIFGHILADAKLTIDGIEANGEWAEMARPYYRTVHAAYVEAAPLPEGHYATVILGDILEHTPDPVGILRRLQTASLADAVFIISLPNIAHIAVRLMLLAGQFPKMERGPLDKTHLQFLTRKTASDMIASAGLVIEKTSCTGVPLDEIWKRGEGSMVYRIAQRSQHLLLDFMPGLFAFQWIFTARPKAR